MARMFPDEVSAFTTVGEAEVYDFLARTARPDNRYMAWYSPDIEDREPDFILLSPECGLIVLEVKDWTLDQILELDPTSALLRIGNKEERRKQPLAQAHGYVHNLLSLFHKHSARDSRGKISLSFPITWGAVFPHITRSDWLSSGFDKALKEKRIIFWDELQETSPLRADASGQMFQNWLKDHFPPQFAFEMTPAKMDWIRSLIFPIVKAGLPARAGAETSDQAKTIVALDQEQENLARHLGSARLLLNGPAGSGKTLILATRAWHLPRVNNKIKKVLITCFNLSLAGYIRRLVIRRGAALGPNGVEIIPFYQLCERIIGEKLQHINEGPDYYELVVQECLEQLGKGNPLKGHWDAIMVDEGQDFTPDMARVITGLLPEHGILTIAQDDNQRLYHNNATNWEQMGIAGLRQRQLKRQYRNTKQIGEYASHFIGQSDNEVVGVAGKKPEMLKSSNELEQIDQIADKVAELARNGQHMGEIAVLYFSSRLNGKKLMPEAMLEALEARGILGRWLNRDIGSKSFYDITTDSVTISTVHSVKGMDFANVFLAGFEKIDPDKQKQRQLAYVGMTRARERLFICQAGTSSTTSL